MKGMYRSILYREFTVMKRDHITRFILMLCFLMLVLIPTLVIGKEVFFEDMEGIVMFPIFMAWISACLTMINKELWKRDKASGFELYYRALPLTSEEKAKGRILHRAIVDAVYLVLVIAACIIINLLFGLNTLNITLSVYFAALFLASCEWWVPEGALLLWDKGKIAVMGVSFAAWIVVFVKVLPTAFDKATDGSFDMVSALCNVPFIFPVVFLIFAVISHTMEYKVTKRLFERKETGIK